MNMQEGHSGDDGRIVEAMRSRADRGRPRGPECVWADAVDASGDRARGTLGRRWVLAGAAALVVLAASLALWPEAHEVDRASDPSDRSRGVDRATALPAPAATAASASPGSFPTSSAKRVAVYLACVTERGFPLDHAETVGGRRPDWVKTLVDVPADIHRPCLQAIGGRDPMSSSHGHRTSLGRCESVDDEPPIDWRPAPAQSFPGSVVSPALQTLRQGTTSLVLTWGGPGEATLDVPEQVTVECWNGRDWQPAYSVADFGTNEPVHRELEEGRPRGGAPAGGAMARVSASTLTLPVPPAAPLTTYRLVSEARRCSSGASCERVRLATGFVLQRAGS